MEIVVDPLISSFYHGVLIVQIQVRAGMAVITRPAFRLDRKVGRLYQPVLQNDQDKGPKANFNGKKA